MDKIKILKVEPGEPPCVKEIANDFKASQAGRSAELLWEVRRQEYG